MARIEQFFLFSHRIASGQRSRLVSGIIHVIRTGMRWQDVRHPMGEDARTCRRGSSARAIVEDLVRRARGRSLQSDLLMIDATHLKAFRTATSLFKRALPRIGRTKGGLNSKLHAVCNGRGRPVAMLLSEGEISDHASAGSLIDALHKPTPPSRTRASRPVSTAQDP